MKIVSTNRGKKETIEWNGKKVQTGIYKYPVSLPLLLESSGVENDAVVDRKHHGGTDKACYLYPANHYPYWKKLYPHLEIPWGMFGENLTVEGLHEKDIHIGEVLQMGEATVQVTQPRQPCYKLGIRFNDQKVVKQFIESGFPGVYVKVLQAGTVKTEDQVVTVKKNELISVQKVFELLYTSIFQKEAVLMAIDNPFLAESCRRDLLKRWKDYL